MDKEPLRISGAAQLIIGSITRPTVRKGPYFISATGIISFNLASYIQIEGLEITQDPEYISRFSNFDQKDNITSKSNGILFERSKAKVICHIISDLKTTLFMTVLARRSMSTVQMPRFCLQHHSGQRQSEYLTTIVVSGCGFVAFDQKPGDHIQIMYNAQ
ncbi:MAG: hypothetical protein U0T81_12290 [Saprospiraceae bacterium]